MKQLAPNFVEYMGGPNESRADRIHITLNKMGLLFLNRKAHKLLGSPEHVVFFYDEDDRRIVVCASHRQLKRAFPVYTAQGGAYYIVRASPFCRHNNIRLERTEKFVSPEYDEEARLFLDLKDTVNVSGVKRHKKSRKS